MIFLPLAASSAALLSMVSAAMALPRSANNDTELIPRSGFATKVGLGDGGKHKYIKCYEDAFPTHPNTYPTHAETWSKLWAGVMTECGDTQCGEDNHGPSSYCASDSYMYPDGSSGGGGADGKYQICIKAKGNFGPIAKNDMFDLAKKVFYNSVTVEDHSNYRVYKAINFINIISGPDSKYGSGFDLNINWDVKETEDISCGDVVNTIVAAGSLQPDFGAVFGAIGVLCDVISDAD